MKNKLIFFLKKKLNEKNNNIKFENILEIPKHNSQGDISLPCFIFSKEYKKNPAQISYELKEKLNKNLPEFLYKIESNGPYLNFFYNPKYEAKNILKNLNKKEFFNIEPKPKKILIEYPSPNTNKSLHLGHLRNILLGNSFSKILEKAGNKIIKVNLNNDKGIAICKAMLSYKLFGNNKTPKEENLKPDKFVTKYYVLFEKKNSENPELRLEEKAQKMLKKWEEGDDKTIKLWKKLMNWVFEGYRETYKNFKIKHDKEYFESKIWNKGKEIVIKAYKNKVKGFGAEKDGAIYCDLKDVGLDKKYLLRKDGTTLYITQDIYLAKLKEEDFKADRNIIISANEQDYHFKVLFEILKRLNIASKSTNEHYSYGYIRLPDGKMKSRKGNVIEADELFEEICLLSKKSLIEREFSKNLNEKELNKRSRIIAYSAIAFFILKYNPKKDFIFNPSESISLKGETGPYLLYTYARIKSIIRKTNKENKKLSLDFENLKEEDIKLIKMLGKFKKSYENAYLELKPSLIAEYLIKLAQEFNYFYENNPILKEKNQNIKTNRLYLLYKTSQIIKEGLDLLDIEVLEEM